MTPKRSRVKGRAVSGSFVMLSHRLLNTPKYCELSAKAVKLLIDVYAQYKGNNNGDFSIAWKLMVLRGWKSKQTLYAAKDELIEKGYLMLTRQGGKHQCSLYAVTWQSIDECKGKLDIPATRVAPGNWK
jgi:hypothetical protein